MLFFKKDRELVLFVCSELQKINRASVSFLAGERLHTLAEQFANQTLAETVRTKLMKHFGDYGIEIKETHLRSAL